MAFSRLRYFSFVKFIPLSLLQYVLALLWFMHVIGVVVSVLGLIKHMGKIVYKDCAPALESPEVSRVYSKLSVRERELLDYIRMKNIPMFGQLVQKIAERLETVSFLRIFQ